MGGGPASGTPTRPPNKNYNKIENTKKTEKPLNTKQYEKSENTKKTESTKKNRRSLKRNKKALVLTNNFTIYGNNCDKIGNKLESLNKVLNDLTPAVFMLQETKRKMADPPIKARNLSNYQVFELNREKDKKDGGKGTAGGGIAIGVLHELKPGLTQQGDDDTECLSVQVTVENQDFLCVTGYGPQLGDPAERKEGFWKYLNEEANTAKDRNLGLIIQMDTNSWVGPEIIPKDPNKQNSNGKLMKHFLEQNPALTVVNALQLCDGSITRQRNTIVGEEKSVLDVYIVCQKVLGIVKHMKIDHEGKHGLSNFHSKRRGQKVTKSDHHAVILTLDLTTPAFKPSRTSHYNFKDKEGQMMFYNVTDNTNQLTEALSTKGTFEFQVSNWEKQMKKLMFQSFPKIQNRKRKFKEDEVGFLLERRKKLKENPSTVETENEITKVELEIVNNIE